MSDAVIRLSVTFGLFAAFILLEHLIPARANTLNMRRFSRQIGLAMISAVLARLALAGGLASVAQMASGAGIGIFNLVSWPFWLEASLCFLALDLAVWCQHVLLHKVALLWRLHRVHHSDTAMDVSTALRFHPIEIVASLGFKSAVVILLGAPAAVAFAFEIALGAGAMLSHANIALPQWLERNARLLFITPALHLIHHSPNVKETNSNYGFSFSFWDRLFGTYREVPVSNKVEIGLERWRKRKDQTLRAMLGNPWRQ